MKELTLTLPRLGETMEEGEITGWLVEPGQEFKRGEPILEVETDKTVVELPALGDGVLDEFLVSSGDRVGVGAPIARARVADPADWATDEQPVDAGTDTDAGGAQPSSGEVVTILTMPRLGETMEEGDVIQWLITEGASYARGDSLLEIETDKTIAEIPALEDGRLVRIIAAPGERVAVNAPLAEVVQEGAASAPAPAPGAAPAVQSVPTPSVSTGPAPTGPVSSIRATPLARRMARQHGIALDSLTGTGRRGRIERADVEHALQAQPVDATGAEMAFLDTPSGRLAYAVTGPTGAKAATVLLLHGFAGDHTTWAATASALARAGHRVVMPDLPGHGATTIAADTPDALTPPLLALARTLPGLLIVVGHSLGAAAAVALAGELGPDRVARLVLLTPAGCGPKIGTDFVFGMAEATTAGELGHLLRLLGPKGAGLSAAVLDDMAATLARGRLHGLARALATADGRQKIDLLRPLAALTVPVTAIFGTEDQVVSAGDAMNLPFHVGVHFLRSGHMPQWDAPRDVARLIAGH